MLDCANTTRTFYYVNLFVMILIIYAVVSIPKRTTGCLARQLLLTIGHFVFLSGCCSCGVCHRQFLCRCWCHWVSGSYGCSCSVHWGGFFEDDVVLSGRGMTRLECTNVPFSNSLVLLSKGTASLSFHCRPVWFSKTFVVILLLDFSRLAINWVHGRYAKTSDIGAHSDFDVGVVLCWMQKLVISRLKGIWTLVFLCMKILSESTNFSAAPLDCLWYGGVTTCSILFNVQKVLNSLDKKTSAVVWNKHFRKKHIFESWAKCLNNIAACESLNDVHVTPRWEGIIRYQLILFVVMYNINVHSFEWMARLQPRV